MVFTAGGAIGLMHCSDYSRDTIGNTGLDKRRKPLRRRRSLRGPYKPHYDWLVVGTKTSTLSVQLSELFFIRCESWAV